MHVHVIPYFRAPHGRKSGASVYVPALDRQRDMSSYATWNPLAFGLALCRHTAVPGNRLWWQPTEKTVKPFTVPIALLVKLAVTIVLSAMAADVEIREPLSLPIVVLVDLTGGCNAAVINPSCIP